MVEGGEFEQSVRSRSPGRGGTARDARLKEGARGVAAGSDGKSGASRKSALAITVLAGGPGAERAVSLESGGRVCDALVRRGHDARVLDVRPDDLSALDEEADVLFVALHGEFGEDGTLQGILEARGIVFTGSDSRSSALAMDKARTKARFLEAGIPTPRFAVVTRGSVTATAETFGLPAMVKPPASGSSVDTFLVRDRERFEAALRTVVDRYGSALAEAYIAGRELTVGVLDGAALPACEIRTKREFYDYQAKYVDEDTQYLFDLDLPEGLIRRVRELSERAHAALGCRDFCRVDWMVDGDSHHPYAIEVNTIPGFTSHSLMPKAAARAGIEYDALCERIVDLAMRRKARELD